MSSTEKFKSLLFSPLMNASSIYRYSGTTLMIPESLSSHVYEVMVLSYSIANTLNTKFDEGIDTGSLLEKALFHDADEVITGDLPRNTKYATDAIKMSMDHVADLAVEMIEKSDESFSGVRNIWSNAKSGKEGVLIRLSDMLVVAKKAMHETDVLNNHGALKIVSELREHLDVLVSDIESNGLLSEESTEYVTELCVEVRDHINYLQIKYDNKVSSYNLDNIIIESSRTQGRKYKSNKDD